MGYRSRFLEQPWPEVRAFEAGVFEGRPVGGYLLEIIDSVLALHADNILAVTTSMHDLVVVPYPIPEPPMDMVIVRAPGSLQSARGAGVRIDYVSVTGRLTSIERPEDEAVPLFWRFCREEFGISTQPPG